MFGNRPSAAPPVEHSARVRRRGGWALGHAPGRSRMQRGQAIIWLLGTMAAAAAVMYGVFNIAQLNAAKAKTVNAADAAALAGATVEARMLNLVAYNNRSMMANEAFLIQMLSIESWLGYFKNTANNFGTVLDVIAVFFPPIKFIGTFLDETAQVAEQGRKVVTQANNAIIPALELSKTALLAAHTVVLDGGGLLAVNAATQVADANRSNFGPHDDAGVTMDTRPAVYAATLALNVKEWNGFTKQYSKNERTDARDVVLASRDDFSTNRPGQGLFNVSVPFVAGLDKDGGSKLQGFDRWETEDTLELWTWTPKGRKYAPIGWGRANADKNGNSGTTWSPNRSAQSLARSDGANGHSHKNWTGVPAVFDIRDKSKAARATLGVDFLVAVRRPQANTLTTQTLGMSVATAAPTGSSEMNETLGGDQLSALSKARVSFERPKRGLGNDKTGNSLWRSDGAKEYGSLFSPYWEARVTDLTPLEKAGLMTAMGLNPLLAPLTPGGQQ